MQLPFQVDPGNLPREPIIRSGAAGADGTVTLTIEPDSTGAGRLIDYVVVSASTIVSPTCTIYDTDIAPGRLFDGTTNGRGAVAAYNPPRVVLPSSPLIVVWRNLNPGDQATIRIEYRLLA